MAIMMAMIKFDAGPARDIRAASRLGFLRFQGLKGVGLAQPKRKNGPEVTRLIMIRKSGKMTVPSGSICTIGFRLTLPWCLAVGSPSLFAIQAWADSWTLTSIARVPRIRLIKTKIDIKSFACRRFVMFNSFD